jgi:hypothetical protein
MNTHMKTSECNDFHTQTHTHAHTHTHTHTHTYTLIHTHTHTPGGGVTPYIRVYGYVPRMWVGFFAFFVFGWVGL